MVIVSSATSRIISYRSKEDLAIKHQYLLNSRDLLYISNDVQKHSMQAIPKQRDAEARISLTSHNIMK